MTSAVSIAPARRTNGAPESGDRLRDDVSARPTRRLDRTPPRAPEEHRRDVAACESGAATTTGTELIANKWQLVRRLGEGGTATVYEAVHRNGRRGALKILKADLADSAEARDRLVFEAYVANQLRHPGIIRVLDDDLTPQGLPFLVMELLDGESLESRLSRAPFALEPPEACNLAMEILQILAAVHDAGVVHRDIKPDNVFLTAQSGLRILDFGIARARRLTASHTTFTGVAMGTPGYMPNEQASGSWDQVDERTDIWAVGAVLFRMLTGRCVFERDTPQEELVASMTCSAAPVREVEPSVPVALAAVVDKALQTRPQDRYDTARAMREALRAAIEIPECRPAPASLLRTLRPRSAESGTNDDPGGLVSSTAAIGPRATRDTDVHWVFAGFVLVLGLMIATLGGRSYAAREALVRSSSAALAAPNGDLPARRPVIVPVQPGALHATEVARANEEPAAAPPHAVTRLARSPSHVRGKVHRDIESIFRRRK